MRKEQKITVRAWVHVGDQLVNVDTLSTEIKQKLATELNVRLMNALFAGRAVFTVAVEPGKCEPDAGQPETVGALSSDGRPEPGKSPGRP